MYKLTNFFIPLLLLGGGVYWGHSIIPSDILKFASGACAAPDLVKKKAKKKKLGTYCHRIAGGQYHSAYQFPDGVVYINSDHNVVRVSEF